MRILLLLVVMLATVKVGHCVTADEIKDKARSYKNSRNWLQSKFVSFVFPSGSNKCNLFVYDVLKAVSITPPDRHPFWPGSYPIGANEWANPSSSYLTGSGSCWESCSSPSAGDVIAIANENGSGHVGIVTGPGQTTSASYPATPTGLIVQNDWGFRSGQHPTCWRYKYANC